MNFRNYLLFLLILLVQPFQRYIYGSDSIQHVTQTVSADSIFQNIEALGNDSMEGRGTGTNGGEKSATYIARKLMKYKILPVGDKQTYFQNIPMHGSTALPESELKLFLQDTAITLKLGKEYLLYKSGAQTFVPSPVELIFVGYGIIAPEFDYNDYQSIDVKNKIVVFLSDEPFSTDPNYFAGENSTIYSLPESKQRIAISRGAIGSIMIPNFIRKKEFDWHDIQREFTFEDIILAYSPSGQLSVIMNPGIAKQLFWGSDYQFTDILEMDIKHQMHSFPLHSKISFKGKFLEREFISKNVIGLVKGSSSKLKNSYVIISAHYDHLGIGPAMVGDSIYNGVFDNAAGVSALLEIARVIAKLSQKPKRSLVFLFVTGEEKGLLGSTYYVDRPIFPLYKTIANINIDGLAMFDTFKDILAIGTELSTIKHFVKEAISLQNLQLSPVPPNFQNEESFSRSDQISFARAGIPSVILLEGWHYHHLNYEEGVQKNFEWFQRIYHTPFDDLNQPMNKSAALLHTKTILSTVLYIADSDDTPEWNPGVIYKNIRLHTIAEKR